MQTSAQLAEVVLSNTFSLTFDAELVENNTKAAFTTYIFSYDNVRAPLVLTFYMKRFIHHV